MEPHAAATKTALDIASGAIVVVTWASWLPPVAALFSIVWTGIRIWETRTVQGWAQRRRDRHAGP
jgi:hypothetical protein